MGTSASFYRWQECCQCCPLPVKGSKVSKCEGGGVVGWWCQCELDYETVVINFLVDVMVWENFLLVQLTAPGV